MKLLLVIKKIKLQLLNNSCIYFFEISYFSQEVRKHKERINTMTKKRANAEEILGTEMPEIVAQASEKQLKFYKDLTVQKNVELKSINSKEDVDKEIKYLLTLPTWKPVIEDGGQMRAIKNLTKSSQLT